MKKIVMIITLLLGTAFLVSMIYFSSFRYQYYTGKVEINNYEVIDDNHQVISFEINNSNKIVNTTRNLLGVKPSYPSVHTGRDMIIIESAQLKNSTPNIDSGKGFGEYWYITVYQLIENKLVSKRIDIHNMVKSSSLNQAIRYINGSVVEYKGMHYINLTMVGNSSKNVWLNIDKEKIESFSNSDSRSIRKIVKTNYPFSFTYKTNILRNFKNIISHSSALSFSKTPSKDIALFSENKKAFDILNQKDSYLAIIGDTTLEDSVKSFELLVPKGSNIFENITIPGEYSNDGQEHKVNSYEEFKQYFREQI